MIDEKKILTEIYSNLYRRDVDYSLNIFLCGAETKKKDSIRELLNIEFKKDAKFNAVYPEFIFSTLYGKGGSNLLELEDELAKYVDVIVLPLEGIGTYCELGAFAVNKELLPKIIAINSSEFKKSKSFINLGPLELLKRESKYDENIFYFDKGKESLVISQVIERVKSKRYEKRLSYDFENLFNLSRFILYLIAIFQPIEKEKLIELLIKLDKGKIKLKFVEASLQVLTQKNRIEQDVDSKTFKSNYSLSKEGHIYVFEELIPKLQVKRNFSYLRSEIINDIYKPKKKILSRDKKLLV